MNMKSPLQKIAVIVFFLLSSCSEYEVGKEDGVRTFVFPEEMEVTSPHNKQIYIKIRNNEFNDLGLMMGRSGNIYGVKDNIFSHSRFAILTRFHGCDRFEKAYQSFETTLDNKGKYDYGVFGDGLDEALGVTGEVNFLFIKDSEYNLSESEAEFKKCVNEMQALQEKDISENFGKKPFFIYWVRIEDNSDSEKINDVYLERVSFYGHHNALGEIAEKALIDTLNPL